MKPAASGVSKASAGTVASRKRGTAFTLLSTVFFGMAPIFGKLAYRAHVGPFTLVSLRTVIGSLSS